MIGNIINYIIIAIFGLAIGSLLNVIILRFDDLKTIFTVRSHCPKCKKQLAWYELIPFFSYVALWGKCRTCKKDISIQYPLVEVGTAIIFGLLFWKFGLSLEFFFLAAISAILIVIFTYDILYQQIADILIWISLGIWLIWLLIDYFFIHHSTLILLNSLYGGLVLAGLLAILVKVSKGKWMGAGDISLGFLLGAMVSYPQVIVATFSTFVLGAIVGLGLIALKKKKMKDAVPFAPFLIAGMWIGLFLGDRIINWYLGGIF